MFLLLAIGVVLLGLAVSIGLRAVRLPRIAASGRVREIQRYGFGSRDGDVDSLQHASALDETASRLGKWAARHLGSFREDDLRAMLTAAGMYRISPITFLGYRVISTVGFTLIFIWFASLAAPAGLGIVMVIVSPLVGWIAPMTYLRRRVDRRMDAIEGALPELIDLLVLTVEAGLAFNASLQNAAVRMRGPLGEEPRLTLQEQSMGLSLNAALGNMMERCDTPSTRSFVRSVIQGETLGVSIGTILRNLADEMRKRRRARAEEKAHKAPVKILFPLVFLLFPAMFIVLLYPAVSGLSHAFG